MCFSYTIIRHFHEISNLKVIYPSIYIYCSQAIVKLFAAGSPETFSTPWLLWARNRMPGKKDHWAVLTLCSFCFKFCNITWTFNTAIHRLSFSFFLFKLYLHAVLLICNDPQIHQFLQLLWHGFRYQGSCLEVTLALSAFFENLGGRGNSFFLFLAPPCPKVTSFFFWRMQASTGQSMCMPGAQLSCQQ